jgi:hypothetical protein
MSDARGGVDREKGVGHPGASFEEVESGRVVDLASKAERPRGAPGPPNVPNDRG